MVSLALNEYKNMKKILSSLLVAGFVSGCATTQQSISRPVDGVMRASWYQSGSRTANGERFKPDGLTAAHRTLPFGTRLHLTHKNSSVIVRINDRGPFVRNKQLDLSRGAARKLGCIRAGSCVVKYRVIPR